MKTVGGGGGEMARDDVGHSLRSNSRKDRRHSKVHTAKGLRDRRVRLSAHTAILFYDLQDRLGFDRPSKAVDWLISKSKSSIDKLSSSIQLLPPPPPDLGPNPTQERMHPQISEAAPTIEFGVYSSSAVFSRDFTYQMRGGPGVGLSLQAHPAKADNIMSHGASDDLDSRIMFESSASMELDGMTGGQGELTTSLLNQQLQQQHQTLAFSQQGGALQSIFDTALSWQQCGGSHEQLGG